jgi:hypothetical protein
MLGCFKFGRWCAEHTFDQATQAAYFELHGMAPGWQVTENPWMVLPGGGVTPMYDLFMLFPIETRSSVISAQKDT